MSQTDAQADGQKRKAYLDILWEGPETITNQYVAYCT